MAKDMFGDVVEPSVKVGGRKGYTVSSSIAVHLLVIALVFALPLLAPEALPVPRAILTFVAPTPLALTPPPPPARRDIPLPAMAPADPAVAPLEAPRAIAPEPPVSSRPAPPSDIVGVPGAISTPAEVPAVVASTPPLAPAAPEVTSAPVRLSSGITRPAKTRDVPPRYPPIALAARVQGTVILEVTIGTSGMIDDVKVLRSISLLDQAAVDAVRQWQYTPTLLNGVPVPLVMTVTVTFALR